MHFSSTEDFPSSETRLKNPRVYELRTWKLTCLAASADLICIILNLESYYLCWNRNVNGPPDLPPPKRYFLLFCTYNDTDTLSVHLYFVLPLVLSLQIISHQIEGLVPNRTRYTYICTFIGAPISRNSFISPFYAVVIALYNW